MLRPSLKEDKISEALRNKIVAKELHPGEKLPTYESLMEEFSSSMVTVHRAIGRLKKDGMLTAIERKGVFVSERPPHLFRIGLLLGSPGCKNRFMSCLEHSAHDLSASGDHEIVVFSSLNTSYFNSSEANDIKTQIAARRLAGLIVAFDPCGCPEQGIFDASLPIIYMAPGDRTAARTLSLDSELFARKALSRLKELGAKKIAVLSFPIVNSAMENSIRLFGEYGLESKPEWQIGMGNAEIADQIIRLMLSGDKSQWPEGLILTDDHLLPHVAKGIFAKGIRIPEDIKILSHRNWKMDIQSPFKVEFLGYHTDMILKLAMDGIDKINKGIPIGNELMDQPLFEKELPSFKAAEEFSKRRIA